MMCFNDILCHLLLFSAFQSRIQNIWAKQYGNIIIHEVKTVIQHAGSYLIMQSAHT